MFLLMDTCQMSLRVDLPSVMGEEPYFRPTHLHQIPCLHQRVHQTCSVALLLTLPNMKKGSASLDCAVSIDALALMISIGRHGHTPARQAVMAKPSALNNGDRGLLTCYQKQAEG